VLAIGQRFGALATEFGRRFRHEGRRSSAECGAKIKMSIAQAARAAIPLEGIWGSVTVKHHDNVLASLTFSGGNYVPEFPWLPNRCPA